MTALARATMLNLRIVAPYRLQLLGLPLLTMAALFGKPEGIVPVALLSASPAVLYPFLISERADLDTLYAVLPLTRRSLLLGRYTWALATFVATAGVGIPLSLIFARLGNASFAGNTLTAVVALSWALFALNISIQFPLYIRFGYTRAGALGTTVPVIMIASLALAIGRAHVIKPDPAWLILPAAAGVVLFCASAAFAMAITPRRTRRPVAG